MGVWKDVEIQWLRVEVAEIFRGFGAPLALQRGFRVPTWSDLRGLKEGDSSESWAFNHTAPSVPRW